MKAKKINDELLKSSAKGTRLRKRTAIPGDIITREIDGVLHQGKVIDATTTTTTTTTTTFNMRDPRSLLIRTKEVAIKKKYNFPVNIKFKAMK